MQRTSMLLMYSSTPMVSGMHAGGVDQGLEGLADGGDIVHEVVDDQARYSPFLDGVGFGAELLVGWLYRGKLFNGCFIYHTSHPIGPGDAEEASAVLVGDFGVERFAWRPLTPLGKEAGWEAEEARYRG